MNWAIGLHTGVARPQGKASQYISPVRDAGVDYRAASGRGYSSNAKLDFHVDGADLATLADPCARGNPFVVGLNELLKIMVRDHTFGQVGPCP